jgi:hypothetical protein
MRSHLLGTFARAGAGAGQKTDPIGNHGGASKPSGSLLLLQRQAATSISMDVASGSSRQGHRKAVLSVPCGAARAVMWLTSDHAVTDR